MKERLSIAPSPGDLDLSEAATNADMGIDCGSQADLAPRSRRCPDTLYRPGTRYEVGLDVIEWAVRGMGQALEGSGYLLYTTPDADDENAIAGWGIYRRDEPDVEFGSIEDLLEFVEQVRDEAIKGAFVSSFVNKHDLRYGDWDAMADALQEERPKWRATYATALASLWRASKDEPGFMWPGGMLVDTVEAILDEEIW